MANAHAAGEACICKHQFQHPEVANEKYVVYFDDQRRWLRVSPGVAELIKLPAESLVGKTLDAFVPNEVGVNPTLFEEFLELGYQNSVIALVTGEGKLLGVRAFARRLDDGCLVMCWEKL